MYVITHPITGQTLTVTPTAYQSGRYAPYVLTDYLPTADDRRQIRVNNA